MSSFIRSLSGPPVRLSGVPWMRESLTFSTDLRSVGFVHQSEDRWSVRVDDRPVGPEDWHGLLKGSPWFSPGGDVYYAASRGQKWFMVRRGEPLTPADAIAGYGVRFSDQGRSAWAERVGGRWHAVLDGERCPACDDLSPVLFSEAGAPAWVERRGATSALVTRSGSVYEADQVLLVGFSGEEPVALARNDAHWVAVRGAQRGEALGAKVGSSCLVDGQLLVAVENGARWSVLKDGVEVLSGLVDTPKLMSQGAHYAIWARSDSGEFLHSGAPGVAPFEGPLTRPALSQTGRLACWVKPEDDWALVTDGVVVTRLSEIGDHPIVWDPTGERVAAIVGGAEGTFIFLDGAALPAADEIAQMVWSPDGGHLAWVARDGAGWRVHVASAEADRYWRTVAIPGLGTRMGGGVCWLDERTLRFTIIDEVAIHRVDAPLDAPP